MDHLFNKIKIFKSASRAEDKDDRISICNLEADAENHQQLPLFVTHLILTVSSLAAGDDGAVR